MATDATSSFAAPAAGYGNPAADRNRLSPVVWIFLFFVTIPIEFNIGPVSLSPLRVLLLFMIIPMTSRLFSGRFGKVMLTDYLFFIHILWACMAVAINNPSRAVENAGSTAVEFLGGYLVARAYVRTPAHLETVVKIIVLLVAISIPFALYESRTGHAVIPNLINKLPGLKSVKQVIAPKRHGMYRVQYVFAHPIHYGLFCSVSISLLLVGLRDRVSATRRYVGAGIAMFGLLLALSSGPLLAVMIQLGLATWARMFNKVQRKWLLLLGMFAFAYIVVDLISNRTPMKVLMSYVTFSAQTAYYRSIIYDWGMRNVWANPIFGLGLRMWVRPSYMITGTVDNFWLLTTMRYGIPGFVFLAVGYASGLYRIARADLSFSDPVSRLRFAWIITFCGITFTLITVHVWSAMYSFTFFFFGTGMWMIGYGDDPANRGDQPQPAAAPARRKSGYARELPREPSRAREDPRVREDRPAYRRAAAPEPEHDSANAPANPTPKSPYTRFARRPNPPRR